MVKTCVRTAGAAYWVRERNSAEPNGPMKIPESPNSTAMASSDGVKAAMTIGIPMPIMEMAVTRGAWSTAIGRQVHSKRANEGTCGDRGKQQPAARRPVLRGGNDDRDDREATRTDLAEAAGQSQCPKRRLLHDFPRAAEQT